MPLSAEQEKALATYRADRAALAAVSYDAILAALDAADAQGYARALGQIESLCADDQWALALHTAGDALAAVANWARERLPAAAEKEHGG